MDIKTTNNTASLTLRTVHKEYEGIYTAQLRTWDGTQEHSAFVYVKGEDQHEMCFFNLYFEKIITFYYPVLTTVLLVHAWLTGFNSIVIEDAAS